MRINIFDSKKERLENESSGVSMEEQIKKIEEDLKILAEEKRIADAEYIKAQEKMKKTNEVYLKKLQEFNDLTGKKEADKKVSQKGKQTFSSAKSEMVISSKESSMVGFQEEVKRALREMSSSGFVSEKYLDLGVENIDDNDLVDPEKVKKNLDSFVLKSFLVGYRKEEYLEEANISMQQSPKKFGEYSINPDDSGIEYIKNKEAPKIAYVLNMEDFIGKSHLEVREAVIKEYGETCRIPDLKDELYIMSLPVSEIPKEMKEEVHYYFMGSTLCGYENSLGSPCLDNYSGEFLPSLYEDTNTWTKEDRVLLLKK